MFANSIKLGIMCKNTHTHELFSLWSHFFLDLSLPLPSLYVLTNSCLLYSQSFHCTGHFSYLTLSMTSCFAFIQLLLIQMSTSLNTEGVLDKQIAEDTEETGASWCVTWRLCCHSNSWIQDEVIVLHSNDLYTLTTLSLIHTLSIFSKMTEKGLWRSILLIAPFTFNHFLEALMTVDPKRTIN